MQNITSELTDIARSVGIEGSSVEAIINLLARAVYENQIIYSNLTLESSFNRSKLLNSKITHAMDRGHSVFRGTNQMVTFKNLTTVSDLKIKKFDTMADVGGLKLVYARDYQLAANQKNVSIDCIVCNTVKEKEIEIGDDNLLISYITEDNISESLAIFVNDEEKERSHTNKIMKNSDLPFTYYLVENESAIPTNKNNAGKMFLTKDGRLYSSTEGSPYLLSESIPVSNNELVVQTISGYGIAIINREINGFSSLSVGDILKVKYLLTTDEEIDTASIKSIPNFNFGENLEIVVSNPVEPNRNIDDIYMKASNEYLQNFVIRSNSDLLTSIKSYFDIYTVGLNLEKKFFNENQVMVTNTPYSKISMNLHLKAVINSYEYDSKDGVLQIYSYSSSDGGWKWIDYPTEGIESTSSKNVVFVRLKDKDSSVKTWSYLKNYKVNDIVSQASKYYRSLLDDNKGNNPTQLGDKWEVVEDLDKLEMNASYIYYSDTGVYISKKNISGVAPNDFDSWDKSESILDFVNGQAYLANDEVIYKLGDTGLKAVYSVKSEVESTLNKPWNDDIGEIDTDWVINESIEYYDKDKEYKKLDYCLYDYVQNSGVEEDFIKSNLKQTSFVIINANYYNEDGEVIPLELIESFKNYIQQAYYISNLDFRFNFAKKYNNEDFVFGIKIHYDGTLNSFSTLSSLVSDSLELYSRRVGETINLYSLMADLNAITGVKYVEVTRQDRTKNMIVNLKSDEFLYISQEAESIAYQQQLY